MAPKLYMMEISPPVRSVLLTAEALGITLERVHLDVFNGEQLKPEFQKMNPQHTIPTLDDDGKVIWDSHAINIYLVEKYGKDDSLYPKDPYTRAVVNQRLYFDCGVVFPTLVQAARPIIREGAKNVAPETAAKVMEVYDFLEKFLEGKQWVASNNLTLADLSLIPSITQGSHLVPIDKEKYPNITSWIERARELPYYEVNQNGLNKLKEFLRGKLDI